ncbi:unnamed protein product [Aspergillus oryzae]|uniref:DNA, SC103 n=1 Tax=Aspergillus oryzae (strain ATCC 42149 / RIB 40) TaxID=510516 RepID=Q2TYW8_ASPOR|nr:unnamed protein product [Aspergillus oryzae RIB40]BAE65555.1 unnamed protein product [Aspergillus oryzae RIB40]GMF68234.1 unnamed protein product [Aspergillus oryzae]GMF83757.1 unnamed protein product [Aspergillus oryzae]
MSTFRSTLDEADPTSWLKDLETKLIPREKRTGWMKTFQARIRAPPCGTVHVTAGDLFDFIRAQANAGDEMMSRYEQTGRMGDLEEAIKAFRWAVYITPENHPYRAAMLYNYGNMLERRYEKIPDEECLKEAICVSYQVVQLVPKSHPFRLAIMDTYGKKLRLRYKRTQQIEDLEEVIWVSCQAIQAPPTGHPRRARWLNIIGRMLKDRYEHIGQIEDLGLMIKALRSAAQVTYDTCPDLVTYLSDLGYGLTIRYERTGEMKDLAEVLEVFRKVVQATPDTCPDLANYLTKLGVELTRRYERIGRTEDLAEAIQVFRRAVQTTADTSSDLARYLTNVGSGLTRQYEREGRREDLEEAIELSRRAIRAMPMDSPDLATHLTNLGYRLVLRHERTNKMDDLQEAITLSRQAEEASYNNDSDSTASVGNLGGVLLYGYKRTKQMDHLEEAYQICRKAVQITPVDDPYYGKWLCNLAHVLTERYEHTRQRKDLEVAIWWSRKSIQASFDGDIDLRAQYNNLGTMRVTRYEQTWQFGDLEEAIRISRRAIKATPDDHPYLAGQLKNLGAMLKSQYERTGCLKDLEEAIHVSRKAARITSALPLERISAASLAIRLMLKQEDYNNSYALCVEALDLLQLVCSRHLTLEDQQYVVSHFSGLATLACSLALQVRQPPFRALQLLEAGRSVIFGLIMNDRSNTSKLKAADPTLCALYEELRLGINDPAESSQPQYVDEAVPTRRLQALKKLEKCLHDIRQLPAFDSFQQDLNEEQMKDASLNGSIIVVNITRLRSDAIVVSQAGFSLVPLPGLGAVQAQRWIDQEMTSASSSQRGEMNKRYREFLGWLWYECAEPILTKLGYNVQSSPENLPRTWWIGTGLASSFPFHAARGLRADENDSTSSRVLSSYTTTIKALLHARERVSASFSPNEQLLNLLMVTMAHTPGEDDLPGVECERSIVLDLLGSSVHVNKLDQPDSASVMRQIGDCHIAHFACHGMSDLADPFQSGLLLQTKTTIPEKEILSVRKLCKQNLPHGEIAYLSACSTAENRAKQLLDEVVHVVNGFQVAGFRHVIGALWPSDDRVCVKVAKLFYTEICRNGVLEYTDRDVALALHKAVSVISTSDDYRKRPLHWAQYVHYGA